jgi:hypothetical protein
MAEPSKERVDALFEKIAKLMHQTDVYDPPNSCGNRVTFEQYNALRRSSASTMEPLAGQGRQADRCFSKSSTRSQAQ